jgi:hypothetical protein
MASLTHSDFQLKKHANFIKYVKVSGNSKRHPCDENISEESSSEEEPRNRNRNRKKCGVSRNNVHQKIAANIRNRIGSQNKRIERLRIKNKTRTPTLTIATKVNS